MKQTGIAFKSKDIILEGVLSIPQGLSPPFAGVVVCHPHPFFGGNMDNDVVLAICEALSREGIATLRFNFRGVGSSEGSFSNGSQEQEDAKAALQTLKSWPGIDKKRVGMAGYSFGAAVILGGLSKYRGTKAIALVSPPVSAVQHSALKRHKGQKLFLVGGKDRIVPPSQLKKALAEVKELVELHIVPGGDHSLKGCETSVARLSRKFFARTLR